LNQVIEEAAESNPNAQFIVVDLAQLKMMKKTKKIVKQIEIEDQIEEEPKNHANITTTLTKQILKEEKHDPAE